MERPTCNERDFLCETLELSEKTKNHPAFRYCLIRYNTLSLVVVSTRRVHSYQVGGMVLVGKGQAILIVPVWESTARSNN